MSHVRVVLLWLLALALPMQGLAAATMLHCGPSHHARAAFAPGPHDLDAHGHADHQDHHTMTQAHGHDVPNADDAVAELEGGQDANFLSASSTVMSKCSACASCCSAVALPAAITQVAVVQQPASRFPPLLLDFAPVVPGGLERPPRSFLA